MVLEKGMFQSISSGFRLPGGDYEWGTIGKGKDCSFQQYPTLMHHVHNHLKRNKRYLWKLDFNGSSRGLGYLLLIMNGMQEYVGYHLKK